MARAKKGDAPAPVSKRRIEQYDHRKAQRKNNPPVGLVTEATDLDVARKTYQYDPHRDPALHWAGKAEHTSFEVPIYVFDGAVRKYRPDFLIRLTTGTMLVLEVKGQDSAQSEAKRRALDEWTRAVTQHGGFGRWAWAVSRRPGDLVDLVAAAVDRSDP